jgi:hypothetical protein
LIRSAPPRAYCSAVALTVAWLTNGNGEQPQLTSGRPDMTGLLGAKRRAA